MGVRDLGYWTKEARRKSLTRRKELAEAALLARRNDDEIRSYLDRLRLDYYELDYADEIDRSAKAYEERVAKGLHRPRGKIKRTRPKRRKK
jgi:hypothetical protein